MESVVKLLRLRVLTWLRLAAVENIDIPISGAKYYPLDTENTILFRKNFSLRRCRKFVISGEFRNANS